MAVYAQREYRIPHSQDRRSHDGGAWVNLDDPSINQQGFAYADLLGLDKWGAWTPTRTSWTDVGTPTVTALFRAVGRQCFFQIKVVPSTSVATTAGTSYVSLPIAANGIGGDASMVNRTSNVAVGSCVIDETNSRLYVPTQAASGNTFTLSGWYQI